MRKERDEMEAELEAVTKELRELQVAIHEFEAGQAKNRLETLRARAGKYDLGLRCELSARNDELEKRNRELSRQLEAQRVAYDMIIVSTEPAGESVLLRVAPCADRCTRPAPAAPSATTARCDVRDVQASRKHMEGECSRIEDELRTLAGKLGASVSDKMDLEDSLRQARGQVTYLQGEMMALARERDSLKGQILVRRWNPPWCSRPWHGSCCVCCVAASKSGRTHG